LAINRRSGVITSTLDLPGHRRWDAPQEKSRKALLFEANWMEALIAPSGQRAERWLHIAATHRNLKTEVFAALAAGRTLPPDLSPPLDRAGRAVVRVALRQWRATRGY
jgi:hypothetical protein